MDQKGAVKAFFDKVVYYTPYEERYRNRTNLNAYDILTRKDVVLECLDRLGIRRGRLLDVGCGPAVYTPDLTRQGFEVWGVDLAPDVVNRAMEIMSHSRYADKAHFRCGDIEHIEFPDETFDVVIVMGLFDYLPSDEAALTEVHRVLKPGGVAFISLQNRYSYCTVIRSLVWPFRPLLRHLFGSRFRGRELCGDHWTRTHTLRAFRQTALRTGMTTILEDFVNFNLIPFNLPWSLPRFYFALLNRFNSNRALRNNLSWLYATSLVALRNNKGEGR